MIVVEAKIKILNPDIFRKEIKKLAKFIETEHKIDDYYTLQSTKAYPKKSLRIRRKDNIYEINFKEKLSYIKGIHAKNEHEFIIDSINPFLDLIKDFGFKHWLRKEKTTELYNISKNFNIELNHVKSLGWFLEIEYLTDKEHILFARKRILKIMKKLNIHKEKIMEKGYTKILWNKNHKL